MSWVILALRKSELKMTQSQYVARELQISRAQRQDARRYQHEQLLVRNDQRNSQNSLYSSYKQNRDAINQQVKALREANNTMRDYITDRSSWVDGMEDGDEKDAYKLDLQRNENEIKKNEDAILSLQTQLSSVKEDYDTNLNELKTQSEDDLEMIETEANDVDTMHEEEKVEVETQLESVKQELQTISDAISQYIQSEAIKI